ncbi:MAG: cyanophycinase [Prolixibacteraceae bacterium]
MMKFKSLLLLLVLQVTIHGFSQTPISVQSSTTKHGPENGSLLIIGGGKISSEIWSKFTELAGGAEHAAIVVITTAMGDSIGFNSEPVEMLKRETNIRNVTLLHTKNLTEANSEEFVSALRKATGVFFTGGRQWRIADSYLNTLTHQAFFDVLKRGGVIAGTSAGASIQASFLWRGDTSGAQILVGDHTQGLGFLRNSVIDQHLLTRNRMFDLVGFIQSNPQLIGLGIDESTAVLVQKDTLQVLGKSYVAIYDSHTMLENSTTSGASFFFLGQGQKYDLDTRSVIRK